MQPLFFVPEIEVAQGDLQVIMVFSDVFDALALKVWNTFGVENELFEFVVDTLVGGLDVDDGAKLRLVEDVVVLGFSTADADDTLRHGKEGVHRGGVAVELVEDSI